MADYTEVDSFVSGTEVVTQTQGKYFLIHVPNYNDGTVAGAVDANGIPLGTNKLNSYIRLGAAAPKWIEEPGADLVRLAYLVGPAGKEQDNTVVKRFTDPSSPEYDATLATLVTVDEQFTKEFLDDAKTQPNPDYDAKLAQIDKAAKEARAKAEKDGTAPEEWPEIVLCPPFIDDQRTRGTSNTPPDGSRGHGLVEDDRRLVSEKLHTRGGWRDHSDGNRITTTRGDKIEVIQGSYKLIVMGRQTDTGQGMGWEASGNNVQDFAGATMPGASVTVEWVNHRYGGVWLLQNSTENVYQYSRNAGNFREQNWGDLWETYVGSENPPEGGVGVNDDDGLQGHPKHRDEPLDDDQSKDKVTREKLRAPSVSSAGLPRGNPHIVEKTWARKIESYTGSSAWRIPEMIEETWVDKSTSKTDANSIDEETTCSGTISSKTSADAMTEVVTVGSIASTTSVGNVTENTNVGIHTSLTTAAAMTDITIAAAKTDVTVFANQLEVSGGLAHESFELAAMLDVFIGAKLEICAALGLEINFGQQVSINFANTLDINIGGSLELNPKEKVELQLTKFGTSVATKLLGANFQIG